MILPLLLACITPETTPVTALVLEVGSRSMVVEATEGLPPGEQTLAVQPGLGRQISPGDRIEGVLRLAPEAQPVLITATVTGHELIRQAQPLAVGERFPRWDIPTTPGPDGLGGSTTVGVGQDGVVVLTFLFTSCPMPQYCPLLSSKLALVQGQLAGKAQILAVTLDPPVDSLEVLGAYGERVGADPAVWRFGRLELDEVEDLLVTAGTSREEVDDSIRHNLRLLVLDRDGRITWLAEDNSWDPAELVAAVEALD